METAKVIRKSYKFRIYPTKAQTKTLCLTLDLCRELYNAALQERRDAWRLERKSISYYDQQNQLPEIKKIREDLIVVNAQVLCDVLNRLDKNFKAFFSRLKNTKKGGFPRFKNENSYNSFTYSQMKYRFRLENDKLVLSKIGKIKIKIHRKIIGKIKTCTIKREISGKWFAVFSVECEPQSLKPNKNAVGIDFGLTNLAVLSNGEIIPNPRFYKTAEVKLSKANRKLSSEKKGSKERIKRRKIVARIYEQIKNRRDNFAHQISRKLVNNFGEIFFEDLDFSQKKLPKNLNKAIHDASWKQIIFYTFYKAESADRIVKFVNPRNTSQKCSKCGETVEKTLAVKVHDCHKCGLKICRDLNAAKNILTLGLQSLAKA